MPKYREIINKIQVWKNAPNLTSYSIGNFTQTELELIKEALETIQFLEIVFKERRIKDQAIISANE